MKYIAFYLPQYHEIKENNDWWGSGFTEWTNVKKASPYFVDHYQPRRPYKNNYYNLLDIDVLKNQAALAKEYGIYGFCFYHYWFKDGRKLLEKPAELLLENKDISLRFCFSWANEPWTRSWDGKNGEVIMPQDYGDIDDWKKHFDYLLPFFKDPRYIKIDNKPVFVIYKPDSFNKMEDMIDMWRLWAKKEGLPDLFIIRTLRSRTFSGNNRKYDAAVEFEPAYSNFNSPFVSRFFRKITSIVNNRLSTNTNKLINLPFNYKKVTNLSLKKKPLQDLKTIPGIFVNWDNTPRKGEKGIYFKNFSIKNFYSYLLEKSKLAKKLYNSEFLFINAWNEWAEGAYLEPDDKYEFSYLETVKSVSKETEIKIEEEK